jgi:hypothetical protein
MDPEWSTEVKGDTSKLAAARAGEKREQGTCEIDQSLCAGTWWEGDGTSGKPVKASCHYTQLCD